MRGEDSVRDEGECEEMRVVGVSEIEGDNARIGDDPLPDTWIYVPFIFLNGIFLYMYMACMHTAVSTNVNMPNDAA